MTHENLNVFRGLKELSLSHNKALQLKQTFAYNRVRFHNTANRGKQFTELQALQVVEKMSVIYIDKHAYCFLSF